MIRRVSARRWPSADPSAELQRQLEHRLASHFGRRRAIVALVRRLSPYSSSFPVEELDVRLEDGAELQLVLKDLSAAAISPTARRARPEFLYEPRRELQTYRWILPHAPAGTATWYGAVENSTIRRHWLFLERVPGLELRHVGGLAVWERAARWIADFHQAFRPGGVERLVQTARLLVYDEAFYWLWFERAQRFAAKRPKVRTVLDRIARGYPAVVERLVSMPHTLIHGEYYPCNILVGRVETATRVCPVDWEMAALAPPLIDLASLTTGWARASQRALVRAYRDAVGQDDASCGHRLDDFDRDLECCRLHLAVRMLGWSEAWRPPPQHTFDWLAAAERSAETLAR
jgi:Phosphotransferase enzyme family